MENENVGRNDIMLEIAKNHADKVISDNELEKEKKTIINNMNSWKKEIISETINSYNTPKKYKIPFTVKFNRFYKKLKKVIGI